MENLVWDSRAHACPGGDRRGCRGHPDQTRFSLQRKARVSDRAAPGFLYPKRSSLKRTRQRAGAQAAFQCSAWQVAGPVPPSVRICVLSGGLCSGTWNPRAGCPTAHRSDLCDGAEKLSLQEKHNFSKPPGGFGSASPPPTPLALECGEISFLLFFFSSLFFF